MDARTQQADEGRVSFSIRIDRELHELVKTRAKEEDRAVASLVRSALRDRVKGDHR